MSDCQEKGAGKHSPPGIPLQTNSNPEFSQRVHGDNSSRHLCINQPSRGKSTQVSHKWAGLDFIAFFQEKLISRIHIALESTDKRRCCRERVKAEPSSAFGLSKQQTCQKAESQHSLKWQKICSLLVYRKAWELEMKQVQSAVCQRYTVLFCALPSSDKKAHHICWGHPSHCRGHPLPSVVRQNDWFVLTDQGCTSWKQHKSKSCILLGTLLLCIFPLGSSSGGTYSALCQPVFLKWVACTQFQRSAHMSKDSTKNTILSLQIK